MATIVADRAWIGSELLKLVDAERSLAAEAKVRAESPPLPLLAVLYHEIADQDEHHLAALETIAARYGMTPTRVTTVSGVSEMLGRLKDEVAAIGGAPSDRVRQDLTAKSNAIDSISIWASALESIGDSQSSQELSAILKEDQAHHLALLEGVKRIVIEACTEGDLAK